MTTKITKANIDRAASELAQRTGKQLSVSTWGGKTALVQTGDNGSESNVFGIGHVSKGVLYDHMQGALSILRLIDAT